MEHFKINAKKFSMPTGWHEVSFDEAVYIIENDCGTIEIFSRLSGLDQEYIKGLDDVETVNYFVGSFGFLSDRNFSPEVPLSFYYDGTLKLTPSAHYNNIKDWGKMSVGQIEDMKKKYLDYLLDIRNEEDNKWSPSELEMYRIMPEIVAIYVQPILWGKYDYEQAGLIAKDIGSKMSFKDIVSICSFFFLRLNALLSGYSEIQQIPPLRTTKYERVSRNFQKGLGSIKPSI